MFTSAQDGAERYVLLLDSFVYTYTTLLFVGTVLCQLVG